MKTGSWVSVIFGKLGGGYNGNYGVPEKSCPCGSGACLILTSNTDKNPGRKFYKCPITQENGGCGFFVWCDHDSNFPPLKCPCGGGKCRIMTAKTGNNIGSRFYCCPGNEGSSCGFFKWCNPNTTTAKGVRMRKAVYRSNVASVRGSYGATTGSSTSSCCSSSVNNAQVEFGGRDASTGSWFMRGKTGHLSRDCPSNMQSAGQAGSHVVDFKAFLLGIL